MPKVVKECDRKDDRVYLRVSPALKIKMENRARLLGFDKMSKYLLYLVENDLKE